MALNGRLGRAQFVNPPTDNFNRLLQSACVARQCRLFGNQQMKCLPLHRFYIKIDGLIKPAENICHHGLREAGKHFARQFDIVRITNGDRHTVTQAAKARISDLAPAQSLTNIRNNFFNAFALHNACIDF